MIYKKMFLNINGAERIIVCDPENDSLADVLRRIGLTGTKVGCETGQCGACSVLLEGEVVRSCITKMKSVPEYSKIVTIEGIGTPDNLHPLQLAWIACGGVQCGFCTPGFIVSAKGLLDKNINPTRQEVRDWFQKHKNACRCTGYVQLVDAVMAAAKVMRGEMTKEDLAYKIPEDGRIYGTSYPRPTALAKVTGACDFGADINMKLPENALHLALVQAGVSHAKIISIDTSEAEKMPGVFKVITHQDVKGTNRVNMPVGYAISKLNGSERPILMEEKIFRYGDVCALVAADNEKNARAAAKMVKVNYEQLPEYLSIPEALAEDAIEIHPGVPNLYLEFPLIYGQDTAPIMEKAPYVVEDSFYTQRQPHLVIEPDVLMGYLDEEGRLTIHCKTLGLHITINTIAGGIGLPKDKIRVIGNPTGGSFGYTVSPGAPALIAVAVLATGRPCCLRFNYEEHMHFTGKRAPSFSNLKMAADEKGKLQAMEFEIAYDKGAYSEVARVVTKGLRFIGSPYTIPNAQGLSKAITTNHCFSVSFRAYGTPQAFGASEQLMDELAEKMGLDPLELRYLNVYRPGDKTINGHTMDVYPMPKLIERLRPKYKKALEKAKKESTPSKLRGVGLACGVYSVTLHSNDHSEVALELNPDGTVTLYNTWADLGQGADVGSIVHTHEALRPLGIKPEQIKLVMNDSALCPNSGGAVGSRSHYMIGNAIIDAANNLMQSMRKSDGTYRSYEEMIKEGLPIKYLGVYDISDHTSELDINTGQGNLSPDYTYGIFMAEVEVDTKTGKTKILKMTAEADIGVIGSRQVVEGQAFGGISQGIGMALGENYDDIQKHTNLMACGFPYINDIPDELEVDFLETPRSRGPQGSSGCGELFQTSPHVAVINAIYNACGVRIREFPATPEKVLAGLKAREKGEVLKKEKYYLGSDLHEKIAEIKRNPVVPK